MTRKLTLSLVTILISVFSCFAQLILDEEESQTLQVEVGLNSPYHTTISFFSHFDAKNFKPEVAARSLDRRGIAGDPEDLAVKLQQIFEGKGVILR